jgi:hypothetical protein
MSNTDPPKTVSEFMCSRRARRSVFGRSSTTSDIIFEKLVDVVEVEKNQDMIHRPWNIK